MFDINPQTQFSHLRELETRMTTPERRDPKHRGLLDASRVISLAAVVMVGLGVAAGLVS